jgi:Protein of unknown function (DUF998)
MSQSPSASIPGSKLILAGIVAGPLFVAVALLQAFTREGFSWIRHPPSMLSLGELGWLQIANFIIAGVLFIVCTVGLGRARMNGVGQRWAPRLLMLLAFSFIAGGAFTPDPALGFPPGAIAGLPPTMSWHAAIHAVAPPVAAVALIGFFAILIRRFAVYGQWLWLWMTCTATVVMLVLMMWPNFTADWERADVNFLPLWAGTALAYGYVAIVLAKLRREIPSVPITER